MKAIVHERYGRPEVLELREVDMPVIEDHQVLVRVHASSVNPAEWYGVTGPFFARPSSGLLKPKRKLIGGDLSGTIEVVGKDVKDFQPGDEVFGTSGGSWAEYAPAREVRLAPKPANVSFEEAAAVPIAAITALQALRDHGHVQPGQKVLINGASGGVGTFAVQLAKSLGAEVTGVCSTRNVELARSLGADHVVDYTQEDFTKLSDRYDLILDIAGSRSFSECRRVLTPEAKVMLVGGRMTYRGFGPLPHLAGMLLASKGRSQTVKSYVAKITKEDLVYLGGLLEAGKVKAVIDKRYALSETSEALAYLGEGHARGKIVITM
ncbi:MAG TPA: NAD(P)-dependent alcohol dehydrogenase [Gaiellaceae bacterium]|jgi:NADPH:quinone reductase-like Zn-dependent oxidoreductase